MGGLPIAGGQQAAPSLNQWPARRGRTSGRGRGRRERRRSGRAGAAAQRGHPSPAPSQRRTLGAAARLLELLAERFAFGSAPTGAPGGWGVLQWPGMIRASLRIASGGCEQLGGMPLPAACAAARQRQAPRGMQSPPRTIQHALADSCLYAAKPWRKGMLGMPGGLRGNPAARAIAGGQAFRRRGATLHRQGLRLLCFPGEVFQNDMLERRARSACLAAPLGSREAGAAARCAVAALQICMQVPATPALPTSPPICTVCAPLRCSRTAKALHGS